MSTKEQVYQRREWILELLCEKSMTAREIYLEQPWVQPEATVEVIRHDLLRLQSEDKVLGTHGWGNGGYLYRLRDSYRKERNW